MTKFRLTRRQISIAGLLSGFAMTACSSPSSDDNSVSLETARAELEAGHVTLIDIREPAEQATGVAKGAKLLPMSQLGSRLGEIPTATDKPVFLICNTQNRSSKILKALRERGYPHVRFVQGGMSEWSRRGWPVTKP